jgi:hypothetical protein
MVISPSVPTITIITETIILEPIILEITIISEVPAIIGLPVVSHPLPVTDPEVVPPLGTAPGVQLVGVHHLATAPGVVHPLATAPGAHRPLVIAPEPEVSITHQEIPEITDLLNPHWEIF